MQTWIAHLVVDPNLQLERNVTIKSTIDFIAAADPESIVPEQIIDIIPDFRPSAFLVHKLGQDHDAAMTAPEDGDRIS
ncbi:MAG TPA: hypothetical protein VIK87_05235 [Sphingomonadales bacterium]